MKMPHAIWSVVVLSLGLSGPAWADDGRRIMEASEQATKSDTEVARYRLDLLDQDGDLVQGRDMLFHFKQLADREATLIRFLSPPAMAGTGLLIEDGSAVANDIWLYLPATRRLRRISGAEKTNWFMGTEFTHEDFEDYQLNLYGFSYLREESCGDSRCHVVAAEANDPAERDASGYARKVYFIEQETQYPVKVEYYSRDGRLAKVLSASDLTRYGAYWRPAVLEMRNLENGRSTRLTVQSRELDGSLDDFRVSSRYLRAD